MGSDVKGGGLDGEKVQERGHGRGTQEEGKRKSS